MSKMSNKKMSPRVDSQAVNYPSAAMWFLVLTLFAVFTITYAQRLGGGGSLIFASNDSVDEKSFLVMSCDDNRIFGWGNINVGRSEAADFGCFDGGGNKINNILSQTDCAVAACQ